jgi:hypothetical protein
MHQLQWNSCTQHTVWAVQDCRLEEVAHPERPKERHVVTCPTPSFSLLGAIAKRIAANGNTEREL